MTEDMLEPSFANAIAAIETATDLTPAQRTHWAAGCAASLMRLAGHPRASPPAGVRSLSR